MTGKPTGHDLRERKVTLPLVSALERVSKKEDEEIRDFFTRIDPTDQEIARIVDIVVEYGGLDYANEVAERYADQAREALKSLPDSPAVTSLFDAVSYAVDRIK